MKNPKRILIRFDRNSGEREPKDDCLNTDFVTRSLAYFRQCIRARGYMYMNEIYENFGVKWDPEMENHVITKDAIRSDLYRMHVVRTKSRRYGWEYYIDIRKKERPE